MNRPLQIALLGLLALIAIAVLVTDTGAPVSDGEFVAATASGPLDRSASGYVRFHEPGSRAFSVSVPADWIVQGGITPRGINNLIWYRLRSADGRAEIRANDPRLPGLILNSDPADESASPSAEQVRDGFIARAYVAPAAFAEQYAAQMADELACTGIDVIRELSHDDVLSEMHDDDRRRMLESIGDREALLHWNVATSRVERRLGGIEFRCRDETDLEGIVHVTGIRVEIPGRAAGEPTYGWAAIPVGFAAPSSLRTGTQDVFSHVVGSYEESIAFARRREDDTSALHRQIPEGGIRAESEDLFETEAERIIHRSYADPADINGAGREIGRIQMEGLDARNRSNEDGMRRWSNTITGTTDVRDAAPDVSRPDVLQGYESPWTDPATGKKVGARTGSDLNADGEQ